MRWHLTFLFVLFFVGAKAQLSNFETKDIDNQWISLSDLKGDKLTVIDFWATWCKPCVNALPKLNLLAQQYKSEGVIFVGVSVDGPRNQAKVKPFTESLGLSYAIIFDPDQELFSELNASVIPTLIIFNSKGKEIYRHEGFQPGDEKLIQEKISLFLSL